MRQTGDENRQIYQLEGVIYMEHQILLSDLQGNVWQLEERYRILKKILYCHLIPSLDLICLNCRSCTYKCQHILRHTQHNVTLGLDVKKSLIVLRYSEASKTGVEQNHVKPSSHLHCVFKARFKRCATAVSNSIDRIKFDTSTTFETKSCCCHVKLNS